ncbi:MAG: hypothetical protein FJ100_03465 [Deltaproteobacteria bacterium]|nr:hypothetical protein [Deltaproteobacteria bacterium]
MSQLSARLVAALFAVGLGAVPLTAQAESPPADAGSAPPEDATALTDSGSSVDAAADATGSDAVSTADTVSQTDAAIGETGTADTGPSSFNENPCWDVKCSKETAACKADKVCAAYAACKGNADCQKKVVTSQAIQDALKKLLDPLQDCGWKSCNDPTGGTCKGNCGKYLGASAKCNCDEACKQYKDCCADKDAVCGSGTCKGACGGAGKWADGSPMPQQGGCFCDDECSANGDCCGDFEKECPGQSGGGDTTKADGSACAPKCTGKNCGDDDGCGGTCPGPCPGGGICFTDSSTGKKACKSSGGPADTSTAGGDAAAATDGGAPTGSGDTAGTLSDAAADSGKTGATGGTGVTANANNASGSSGLCAASPRPAGAGWLVALFAVGLAVAVRRRFA